MPSNKKKKNFAALTSSTKLAVYDTKFALTSICIQSQAVLRVKMTSKRKKKVLVWILNY